MTLAHARARYLVLRKSRTRSRTRLRTRGAASGDIFARHLAAHQRIWN